MSKIYKSLVYDGEISLAVLDTTALVNEAVRRHRLSPLAAAALGRTLGATAYLCSWLKGEDSSLSVTINGGGAGGKIGTAGDGQLRLRGFIERPQVELPPRGDGKLDVGGCVGRNGFLTVIRDDGDGLPFTGTTELATGEIAEDFAAYFAQSEQRPTAVALGVKMKQGVCVGAGGVFLQPLPGASEQNIERAQRKIQEFSAISSLIEQDGAEEILLRFSPSEVTCREVTFGCHCSLQKAEDLVLSLGRANAEEILAKEGVISVYCHYCNTDYRFNREQAETLFRRGENSCRKTKR